MEINNEASRMYSGIGMIDNQPGKTGLENMLVNNQKEMMAASKSGLGKKGMTLQYSVNQLDNGQTRMAPSMNDALKSINMPSSTKVMKSSHMDSNRNHQHRSF